MSKVEGFSQTPPIYIAINNVNDFSTCPANSDEHDSNQATGQPQDEDGQRGKSMAFGLLPADTGGLTP